RAAPVFHSAFRVPHSAFEGVVRSPPPARLSGEEEASMRTALVLSAALVLTAAPCRADDAVTRLIERLGSEEHGERVAATEALVEQGAAAVPALRVALDSPDAEVRRNAAEALERIEARLSAEEALRPRTLRLVYDDVPLADAVADFSRRTG